MTGKLRKKSLFQTFPLYDRSVGVLLFEGLVELDLGTVMFGLENPKENFEHASLATFVSSNCWLLVSTPRLRKRTSSA